MRTVLAAFYGQCGSVLSPSAAADASLASWACWPSGSAAGTAAWTSRASRPSCTREEGDGELVVLYAGRLTREKGIDLLADAFLRARERHPRLRLQLAGGGPEEDALRARLGGAAELLGWLDGDALARAYADADVFLFASETDTFGQVILEAQASGLPVLAVDAGGPRELIAHGRSGCLAPASADALGDALAGLASRPALRAQLAAGGLDAVSDRSWERALGQLAERLRGRWRRRTAPWPTPPRWRSAHA